MRNVLQNVVFASFATVATLVVWTPDVEACSMAYVDVFSQARRADTIVMGTVVPGGVGVDEWVEGSGDDAVLIPEWAGSGEPRNSCVPRIDDGEQVLVFLDESGSFVAAYQSAVLFDTDRRVLVRAGSASKLVNTLRRFVEADDEEARLEVLVDLVDDSDSLLAREAIRHLVDRPNLVGALTDGQRTQLREALSIVDARLIQLAWLMVRLQDRRAAPVLVERMREIHKKHGQMDSYNTDWAHLFSKNIEIAHALEILLNHDHPAVQPGRRNDDVVGELIEDFDAYLEAHPDAGFARGYEERDLSVPTGREELAERIEEGPTELDRIVALERCERDAGTRLYRFVRYVDGVADSFWEELAEACRKGESVRSGRSSGGEENE